MASRLGDLLQRRGDLTAAQLTQALEAQREHSGALAYHLVKLNLISEEDLLAILEREYRLPVVDPASLDIPKDVLALVPQTLVIKLKRPHAPSCSRISRVRRCPIRGSSAMSPGDGARPGTRTS